HRDAAASRSHGPAGPRPRRAILRGSGRGPLVRPGARDVGADARLRRAQRHPQSAGADRMNAPSIRNTLGQGLVPGGPESAGRAPRIVFAMLSAATPPATVAQLARLLA